MSQKETIVDLLRKNGVMTQGDLAESIYGDKGHSPNIYSALDELGITVEFRRRKFDRFVWYKNR